MKCVSKSLILVLAVGLILVQSSQAFDESIEMKERLKGYIMELIEGGHGQLGYESALLLAELIPQIDDTEFVLLDAEAFAYNTQKARRSAFYTVIDHNPVVFVNSAKLPSDALLLHEIIKDRHYEISNSLDILYILKKEGVQNEYDPIVGEAVKNAIDQMVDRFGMGAHSPHQWVDDQVQDIDQNNSTFDSEALPDQGKDKNAAPGGDISGGGGDGNGFELKTRVLLSILRKVAPLYEKELGYKRRSLVVKLANVHFLLSIKIYFETIYGEEDKNIHYNFGTDSIERLLFFPYLVQIPEGRTSSVDIDEIRDVILQSDLFREIPSLMREHNSVCYCNRGEQVRQLPYLCPDPNKMHPATHYLIDFYQTATEKSLSCKIQLGKAR